MDKSPKYSFIVSNLKEIWPKNSKNLFIADKYVYNFLECSNELHEYEKVITADYLRESRDQLVSDSKFVDKKYNKYVKILAARLNKIHNKNYSTHYWKQSLSIAFLRYITTFHITYKFCETYFDSNSFDCHILHKASYYTPFDFEDHRKCFFNSGFGHEQIFSLYINLFYPGRFKEVNIEYTGSVRKKLTLKQIFFYSAFYRFMVNMFYFLSKGIIRSKIKLGLLGAYFSVSNLETLRKKSDRKIWHLTFPKYHKGESHSINRAKRMMLSAYEDDFDKFDKFFFSSVYYCMPKVFVEDYIAVESKLIRQLKFYPKLKFIICENWISHTYNSITLALAQTKGITHIYNEHNSFFHPYEGELIKYQADLSDVFLTLGWEDESNPKITKGASLFPFTSPVSSTKNFDILFIAGALGIRASHYNAAWGNWEGNFKKGINFNINFFNNLTRNTIQKITYRGYPAHKIKNLQLYNKEFYYADKLESLNKADLQIPAKKQIGEARLVIIDYLATSYIECLSMNIPTVIFWNKETILLNDQFSDFFNPLIKAGICQTNAKEAANFIEKIHENPEYWWYSDDVQKARKEFMDKNIADPQLMIDYLLKQV